MTNYLGSLSTYENYRDSGVQCYGSVPAHWKTLANKYIFDLNKNLVGKNSSRYTLLSLTLGGIIKRDMDNPEGKFPAEFDTYQEVTPGDFVFCLFDVEETPRTIGLSSLHGMITGAYTVFRPRREFDAEYLQYLYLSLDSGKRLRFLYKGLRNTIPKDVFLAFKSLTPPIQEQRLIARFLSIKTAQIDHAIQIKEQQIVRLKERQQILIQQTVTRGLDVHATMRYSGVDWIGDIPAHWDLKKIRYLGTTQNGISAGAEFFGHGHPFISYGDVYNNEQLPESVSGLANASVAERSQYSIERGDVLFTRTSETAEEIGFASTCFQTITNATFAGFLIRFRPKTNVLLEGYSKYYFNAPMLRVYFVKEMSIVTRASLSQQLLKNMLVLLPPAGEQKEIYDFLESESAKFKKAIEIQAQQIKNLKEYKVTLVNSTVTGKIKVPGIVEPQVQDMELA